MSQARRDCGIWRGTFAAQRQLAARDVTPSETLVTDLPEEEAAAAASGHSHDY
jgi:hypothetical protein